MSPKLVNEYLAALFPHFITIRQTAEFAAR